MLRIVDWEQGFKDISNARNNFLHIFCISVMNIKMFLMQQPEKYN